jgi:tRNA U34 5-carboxymethylaminomethyl modifying GTPase MnmE/TrmE
MYESWKSDLVYCQALVEAYIDFGEDEHIEADVLEQGN